MFKHWNVCIYSNWIYLDIPLFCNKSWIVSFKVNGFLDYYFCTYGQFLKIVFQMKACRRPPLCRHCLFLLTCYYKPQAFFAKWCSWKILLSRSGIYNEPTIWHRNTFRAQYWSLSDSPAQLLFHACRLSRTPVFIFYKILTFQKKRAILWLTFSSDDRYFVF